MVRKYDYKKMHMISQAMYEKLKKCLSDDKKDISQQGVEVETEQTEQPIDPKGGYQSQYKNPIPGPSHINPETGEYYI
jgi:hypothetical protein